MAAPTCVLLHIKQDLVGQYRSSDVLTEADVLAEASRYKSGRSGEVAVSL